MSQSAAQDRPALPKVDPLADPPSQSSAVNLPNAMTLFRILMVPVFLFLLLHEDGRNDAWRIWAWAVFALACVTDSVDGELARKRNSITEFGKLLDPIADKALIGSALIALAGLDLMAWWIAVVILIREVGVTLLRFWVIRHGVIPASRGGKAKTLTQAVAIGLYILPLSGWLHHVASVILAVAIVLTVVTGVDYVHRAVRLRRLGRRAKAARRS
jgi:CDP-diacylglycerol--glycerol-3-phosphate 3-phosphatidyltransferase